MRSQRLQWQLFFSVFAAVSVAALGLLLIVEAVQSAQRSVIADAHRSLDSALDELASQYRDRAAADPSFGTLPPEAQDVSLRAIGQVVFRSYPDVGGGYYSGGQLLGSTVPEAGPGALDLDIQRSIVDEALKSGQGVRTFPGTRDLVAFDARRTQNGVVVWAMKRLVGRDDPWIRRRALLLGVLGLSALVSVAGAIATGIALRRGVTEIQRGLVKLEKDFAYSLPERNDELGDISGSINRMAAVRRSLESELAREERLRMMGRLVAGVAHEIRNPLNCIRLSMDMVEQRLARNTLKPHHLEMVRSEVDRLNNLLTDLLTFDQSKKPEAQRQTVVPLVERCLDLLRPQANERGIRLSLAAARSDLAATFDPQRLTQALMNLVLNAIQATVDGGAVEVSTREEKDVVRIAVRDYGTGINVDQKERMFEAFYTTKANGTGLGLAVSRELLTSMGGDLTFEDARPGACFVVTLAGAGANA